MNLNAEILQPQLPSITEPFLMTFLPEPYSLLILYAPPVPPQKAEEPKKKFTFKPKDTAVNTSQHVHVFDPRIGKWTTKQSKGKFPSRRIAPSHVCLGPCLLVYGGTQVSPSKQLNDLYALNLNSWNWKKMFTMQAPPAHSNPVLLALEKDKLLLVQDEVWVFQTKDVNWDAEATDLPGGIWEKLNITLPLTPLCGCLHEEQIIIFGKKQGLAICLIDTEEKKAIDLAVEGQAGANIERLAVCATSEGKGLLINSNTFSAFELGSNGIIMSEPLLSQQSFVQLVLSTEKSISYAIDGTNKIYCVNFTVPESQEEFPDTSRQVTTQNAHHSSLIEKQQQYDEESQKEPESPRSTDGLTAPILDKLSPLLAREWLRRRVLEEKSKLLEDTIKKAQHMVLALCRYGNEEEKQIHINKVCRLREGLCKVLQSQNFIRRQMADRPGQSELRNRSLRQVHGNQFVDLSEF